MLHSGYGNRGLATFLRVAALLFCLPGCSPAPTKSPQSQAGAPAVPLDAQFSQTGSPSIFKILKDMKAVDTGSDSAANALEIEGLVLDDAGKPVSDAVVVAWTTRWNFERVLLGKVRADASGHFSLDVSPIATVAYENEHRSAAEVQAYARQFNGPPIWRDTTICLLAADSTNCIGFSRIEVDLTRTRLSCNVKLLDNRGKIGGTLVDPQGEPLAGVEVRLGSMQMIDPQRMTLAPQVQLPPGAHWTIQTDAEGRFAFADLPSNHLVTIGLDSPVWKSRSGFEFVATSPGMKISKMSHHPGPFQLSVQAKSKRVLEGIVVDNQERPVAGIRVSVGYGEAITDESGRYSLAVAGEPYLLQIKGPPEGKYLSYPAAINRKAWRKGEPQPPIKAVEGEWLSGRVVSHDAQQPLPNIDVGVGKFGSSMAVTDREGRFRVLLSPGPIQLWFMPESLGTAERDKCSSLLPPGSVSRNVELVAGTPLDLGDIPLDVAGAAGRRVRVLGMDNQPVAGCEVSLWVKPLAEPSKVEATPPRTAPIRLSLKHHDETCSSALTDEQGLCEVDPVIEFDLPRYVVARYPAKETRYFAEVSLKENDKDVVTVQLRESQPIRGKVTFNGAPLQGAWIQAELVAPVGGKQYEVLRFAGLSDAAGNYEIDVPEFTECDVTLRDGLVFLGNKLMGAEAVRIKHQAGDFIAGPDFSVRAGRGQVSGVVLGKNKRPFSGATLALRLPPGEVIVGAVVQDSDRDGGFTFHNLPEGEFELYAYLDSFAPSESIMQKNSASPAVRVKPGQIDVELRLPRHSR